ncbi:MAG TPA: response regulator [Flavisolibacter sp.]|jgi:two-component system sensor histidine kinase UhpB|nr:response regulator [Flavisolibacter sp.]
MNASELLSILIIEDNPSDSFLIEQMLSSSDLAIEKIFTSERLDEGIQLMQQRSIDVVLSDLSLPDSFGIDTFLKIRRQFTHIPIIILTGLSDSEMALKALKKGAQDYLVKGEFNSSFLVKSILYSIERKKAEEKVLISEEKYRQIFYQNPFPMWITDKETLQILEVNGAAIKKYGYTKEEFLDLTLDDIQKFCSDFSLMALPSNHPRDLWSHFKKNGEEMIVEFTSYPINYFGRTALQIQVNDITHQIKLEKELDKKNQQMIEAVLNAQEQERKIIGEELHDNINQILTAIKINLGFILGLDELRKDLIQKCLDNATFAIEEVRKLSRALILPSNLRELGLVPSLQILAKDIQAVTTLNIEICNDEFDETVLNEEQKTALYRIAQEQMNNILKHAKASNVHIHLSSCPEGTELSINDDGRGFDPATKKNGVGFYNISNRVKLFNGSLIIDSSPGRGVLLSVHIQSKTSRPAVVA